MEPHEYFQVSAVNGREHDDGRDSIRLGFAEKLFQIMSPVRFHSIGMPAGLKTFEDLWNPLLRGDKVAGFIGIARLPAPATQEGPDNAGILRRWRCSRKAAGR